MRYSLLLLVLLLAVVPPTLGRVALHYPEANLLVALALCITMNLMNRWLRPV